MHYTPFYFTIVLAVVLPLVFRRQFWIRIVSVGILLLQVSFHWGHLVALHRLVQIRGMEQLPIQPGQQLPDGFDAATRIVKNLSQAEIPFVMLLFFAFTVLALLPFQRPMK